MRQYCQFAIGFCKFLPLVFHNTDTFVFFRLFLTKTIFDLFLLYRYRFVFVVQNKTKNLAENPKPRLALVEVGLALALFLIALAANESTVASRSTGEALLGAASFFVLLSITFDSPFAGPRHAHVLDSLRAMSVCALFAKVAYCFVTRRPLGQRAMLAQVVFGLTLMQSSSRWLAVSPSSHRVASLASDFFLLLLGVPTLFVLSPLVDPVLSAWPYLAAGNVVPFVFAAVWSAMAIYAWWRACRFRSNSWRERGNRGMCMDIVAWPLLLCSLATLPLNVFLSVSGAFAVMWPRLLIGRVLARLTGSPSWLRDFWWEKLQLFGSPWAAAFLHAPLWLTGSCYPFYRNVTNAAALNWMEILRRPMSQWTTVAKSSNQSFFRISGSAFVDDSTFGRRALWFGGVQLVCAASCVYLIVNQRKLSFLHDAILQRLPLLALIYHSLVLCGFIVANVWFHFPLKMPVVLTEGGAFAVWLAAIFYVSTQENLRENQRVINELLRQERMREREQQRRRAFAEHERDQQPDGDQQRSRFERRQEQERALRKRSNAQNRNHPLNLPRQRPQQSRQSQQPQQKANSSASANLSSSNSNDNSNKPMYDENDNDFH